MRHSPSKSTCYANQIFKIDHKTPKLVYIAVLFTANSALSADPSFNSELLGTWRGKAPTSAVCKNKTQDANGFEEIELSIARPEVKAFQNYTVNIESTWGCFGELAPVKGFIFGDEYWAASDDRMTFVRLILKDKVLTGSFRFDLNSSALKIDFAEFHRISSQPKPTKKSVKPDKAAKVGPMLQSNSPQKQEEQSNEK